MEIATRIFDVLLAKHREQLGGDKDTEERNRQLLRLAALLHDLGHAPFSHAAESLFPPGTTHEDMSARLITETEIAHVIHAHASGGYDIAPEEVAAILTGDPKASPAVDQAAVLREIFAGEFDADRIDYLTRDSVMAGVQYGRFDYERLLHTLTLFEDEDEGIRLLAVDYGGLHSVEGLVLARYYMFTQVYFHPVRRAYDILLERFLQTVLSESRYPANVVDFLEWDDVGVLHLIKEASANQEHPGHEWASRIWRREHYRVAGETNESADREELARWERTIRRVETRFPNDLLIEDGPEKAPHKFEASDTRVRSRSGGFYPITNMSKIVQNMPPIRQRRLYASGDRVPSVRAAIQEYEERHPLHPR